MLSFQDDAPPCVALNQHYVDRQTDEQTDLQTNADRQTYKDRLISLLAGKCTIMDAFSALFMLFQAMS